MKDIAQNLPDSVACFVLATILNEGGGVRNIDGTNNITYCGIREDRYPKALDWEWLKAEEKRLGRFPYLQSSLRVFPEIFKFYTGWFDKARGNLPHYLSPVDCLYYDMTVVAGDQQAVRTLQRALNNTMGHFEGYIYLNVDGRLGPLTRAAMDGSNRHGYQQILLCHFAAEELAFFNILAAEDARHLKHLDGWHNRVERQIQRFRMDFDELLPVLTGMLD